MTGGLCSHYWHRPSSKKNIRAHLFYILFADIHFFPEISAKCFLWFLCHIHHKLSSDSQREGKQTIPTHCRKPNRHPSPALFCLSKTAQLIMLSHYGCMCAGLPRVSQRTMTHLNKLAGEVSHHTLVWNNAFDWSERKKSPVKCMNRFKLFKCLQCCSVCNYSYIGICLACLRKWRSNGWHQNLNTHFKMFQCRNNYSLFVKLDCMIWSSKTKFQLGGNWLLEIEEVSKRVRTCQLSVLTDSVGCSGAWSQLQAFDDSPGGGWHERQGALALDRKSVV